MLRSTQTSSRSGLLTLNEQGLTGLCLQPVPHTEPAMLEGCDLVLLLLCDLLGRQQQQAGQRSYLCLISSSVSVVVVPRSCLGLQVQLRRTIASVARLRRCDTPGKHHRGRQGRAHRALSVFSAERVTLLRQRG